LVEKILGSEMIVNSSHHQAVKDPGTLKITGWAEDDTIEVLENSDHKFVIGVQWHPEMHHDKRLFEALIKAV
jgi:putative glutamine amidotransferase